jgi:hypothetical protein
MAVDLQGVTDSAQRVLDTGALALQPLPLATADTSGAAVVPKKRKLKDASCDTRECPREVTATAVRGMTPERLRYSAAQQVSFITGQPNKLKPPPPIIPSVKRPVLVERRDKGIEAKAIMFNRKSQTEIVSNDVAGICLSQPPQLQPLVDTVPAALYLTLMNGQKLEMGDDIAVRAAHMWAIGQAGGCSSSPTEIAQIVMQSAPHRDGELFTWLIALGAASYMRAVEKQRIDVVHGLPAPIEEGYTSSHLIAARPRDIGRSCSEVVSSAVTAACSSGVVTAAADIFVPDQLLEDDPIDNDQLGAPILGSSSEETIVSGTADPLLSASAASVVPARRSVQPVKIDITTAVELSREEEELLLFPEVSNKDSKDSQDANLVALFAAASDLASANVIPLARFEGMSNPSFDGVVFSPPQKKPKVTKKISSKEYHERRSKESQAGAMPVLTAELSPSVQLDPKAVRHELRKQHDREYQKDRRAWKKVEREARKVAKLVVKLPITPSKQKKEVEGGNLKKTKQVESQKLKKEKKAVKYLDSDSELLPTVKPESADANNNELADRSDSSCTSSEESSGQE